MKISAFKIFTIFTIITIIGLFIVPSLSIKLNPSNTLPSITVSFYLSNTSSYVLERDVTSILESGFSIIEGLEKLDSKSSKGKGYITLSFDKRTSIDIAYFETSTIIRQLYKKLPKRTSYPSISINRPNDGESNIFLSYSINANANPFDIQKTVKTQIEPVIGAINNIEKTKVYGANSKEYTINYNSELLKTLKLTKKNLIEILNRTFKKQSLGEIRYNRNYTFLSIIPKEEKLNWHIPVKKIGNKLIYLDELSTIREVEQEAQSYYRINGKNAITLALYASNNANNISLTEEIEDRLKQLEQILPADYNIVKSYDSTVYLEKELNKIYERSFYTLIILLLFVFVINRSIEYLFVVVISLIVNISLAFLLYYVFSVEIQLYSLAGITISLGLIIDNSIVMIDHIRHQGNRSAFISIMASTLTTIGALSIIYFLDNKYKVNLIDFTYVIIINLGCSLIIALFLIPTLMKKIKFSYKGERTKAKQLKKKFYDFYSNIINFLVRFKKVFIVVIILLFGLPVFMLPLKLEPNNKWYEKAYNTTIGDEWYRETIRPSLDKYLGGSLHLFSKYVFDKAYYNRNEETRLFVRASMPKGATVQQMNQVFIELENYLSQFNEIKQYSTSINSTDFARLEITFKDDFSESFFPFVLKSRLVEKVLDFGGISWSVYGVGDGFNTRGGITGEPINFSVKAKGYNYDALNAWADSLKVKLINHPRIHNVYIRENSYDWDKAPSYEFQFHLDKEQLGLNNVFPEKLVEDLKSLTLSKSEDISINIKGKYSPIRFESNNAKNYDLWDIKNVPLDSSNSFIILKDIATISKEIEEENIYKENQEYIRLVDFQYTGSERFGSQFINKELEKLKTELPLGYSFERLDREWFFNKEQNKKYSFLLILVLGVIYLICSILFESFKQPFIILSIIPISFIGVFLTFYLFDFNFDQGGLASFVLLSGITVNASIFILNDFNKLKKEFPNQDKIGLYLQAFQQKIFPIMLTIISTIIGFIPFIKDGQNEVFWFALGVGTIGGLLFSLIGILIYLPVFTLKRIKI